MRGGKNKKLNNELISKIHIERSKKKTIREIAKCFGVAPTTVHTAINKFEMRAG